MGEDVDRPADLHLILLEEPFKNYSDFMATLRMFNSINFIGRLKEGQRMGLTEKGREAAQQLTEELTDEQRAAIKDVTDDE